MGILDPDQDAPFQGDKPSQSLFLLFLPENGWPAPGIHFHNPALPSRELVGCLEDPHSTKQASLPLRA